MRESLGLNISHNFIRYAKIQNNGNKIIAKALGVKVYDGNPKAVINQIIQETKSEKAENAGQLSMYNYKLAEIASELDGVHLDSIPPIEALNILQKMKDKIK